MKVSIFIPTYDSSSLISTTIDSVLSQTYQDIEILCVDDGSKDNTVEILRTYVKKDSRVKVFQKSNEGSVPFSWNYVCPHLNGEFTIYMSHDDILAPDTIEKLVKKQQSEPYIDCVIPSLVFFEEEMANPEIEYENHNRNHKLGNHCSITGSEAFDKMLDYSIPGFALWRTELIKRIGMPTESFNSDECMQRIWVKNCRKVAFSDAQFGYRQTSNSIVKGLKPYHFFSIATNLCLFKEMLPMENICIERKHKMQYKFYESLFYLDSQYRRMRCQFSTEQQIRFEAFVKESYSLLSKDLYCPNSAKGLVMKFTAKSNLLYSFFRYLKALCTH